MGNDPNGPVSAVQDNPVETPAGTEDAGTIQADPNATDAGQAIGDDKGTDGQADKAPTEPEVHEFFDAKELAPELMPAYRNMQKAYTQKTQAIAQDSQKVEAYNAFMENPVAQLQALAKEYGLEINQPGRTGQANSQTTSQQDAWTPDSGEEPKSWQEVGNYLKNDILGEIKQLLGPTVKNVQKMSADNVEKQLDGIDPGWRMYEDEMKQLMRKHPTMSKDIDLLYRMAVPSEVLQSQATNKALKKLQAKASSSKVHGATPNNKTRTAQKQPSSFQEAVEQAKASLNS